ncbi:MAG: hypothetical protein LBH48_02995 [Bifidobacteriaceae bacterium]|nr:hypothetical protein [Bifidobacteriaceae bacterium]
MCWTLNRPTHSLVAAPTKLGTVLIYFTDDRSFGSTTRPPGDIGTIWFTYMGAATEVDARYAVPKDIAAQVLHSFLNDKSVMPQVPGLTWEEG